MSSQAVRFDANTDKYSLASAGFGGVGQDYTVCMWVYPISRGYYEMMWAVDDGASSYTQFGIYFDGVWLRGMSGGTGGIDGPNPVTFSSWLFVAVSHSAEVDTLYWAAPGDATLSSNTGDMTDAATANTLYLGGNAASDEWLNGRICAVKMWHAALDAADLDAERLSYSPSRLEDLYANWTFWDGPQTTDDSGHGHTLTAGTSPTAEAGPPGLPLDVPPGSFKVGRIRDDANGDDLVDLTADGFTELEWNLQVVPPAAGDDVYEFRVYAGDTPLDTYTATPRFTVTSETVWAYYTATPLHATYYGATPIVPFGIHLGEDVLI